jgi:hypothetical protein
MSRIDGRATCGKPKRNGEACDNGPDCRIHVTTDAPDGSNCAHAISRGHRGLCAACMTDARIAAAVAAERERVRELIRHELYGRFPNHEADEFLVALDLNPGGTP